MTDIDYEDVVKRIQDTYSSCTKQEKSVFTTILREIADKGYSQTYEQIWLTDFKEIPVSIDEFLSNPEYLGSTNNNGKGIYPGWWPVYHSVFDNSNDYNEIVLSGATGTGKTSTAVSSMAYMTYLIMCYREPQLYFSLETTTRIVIAFANLTLDLARSVGYRKFNDTLKESPWFNKHGSFTNERNFIYIPEGGKIDIIPASDSANILGMATWVVLMDECNFLKNGIKDINKAKQSMKAMYDTAMSRIAGRFTLDGKVYGKLFACSSKNSDNDYLSEHVKTELNSGNTSLYYFDKPQWEVQPKEKHSSKMFHITIGDRYKKGFVVSDENDTPEMLQEYENQGYKVMAVPLDYKSKFRADYDINLRDIAGISVVGAMGFFTQELITPCVTTDRINPFFEPILWITKNDTDTIENHFHTEVVPEHLKKLPIKIHIDFAESSDHIGIAGAVQDGTKVITNAETDKKIMMPYFKQLFGIAIGSLNGDKMSYQKVVNFIIWLRREGFNIDLVTTDQYQSSYVRETLEQQGFEVDKVSVDASIEPYVSFKNLLIDQRVELVKYQLQEDEMVHLQRINNVLDHPPQKSVGAGGGVEPNESNGYSRKGIGKDTADAICGALWNCVSHQLQNRPPAKSVANVISSVNAQPVRINGKNYGGKIPTIFSSPYKKF